VGVGIPAQSPECMACVGKQKAISLISYPKEAVPMTTRTLALLAILTALSVSSAFAQALIPTKDPGVARAVLMHKPEVGVDVLRVELQPGAVRSIHRHDDVKFHLFLPLTGSLELTIGDTKSAASLGQAYFIEKGTPHGFRNTGQTPAAGYEVFIREPKTSAANRDNGHPSDRPTTALSAAR
jgi:quercetin dioxygenase-like cupin family protein